MNGGNEWNDPSDLLRDIDRPAGMGWDAPDVDDAGALRHHRVHALHRGPLIPRAAGLEKRIRSPVHDRHDQQLAGREDPAAQAERSRADGRAHHAATAAVSRPRAGRRGWRPW
jgi:hypothetical protein